MTFLQKIQSKWKYQATTHIINTKKNTNYKGFIQIERTEKNYVDDKEIYKINYNKYLNLMKIIHNLNNITINKICENRNINYRVEQNRKNKILIFYKNGNTTFEETVYVININFFFVIGVLKKNNKHKYIRFTSYIKVI